MAEPHIISVLRAKRARIAGVINRLEFQLAQQRADLQHIDGVLRLFQPERDPNDIKPKKTYTKRSHYFGRNELPRLCLGIFREKPGWQSTEDIVAALIAAKGFAQADSMLRLAIRSQIVIVLRKLRKRGTVEQVGLGKGVRWRLAGTGN